MVSKEEHKTEQFITERVNANHKLDGRIPASLAADCDKHVACSCGSFVSYSCDPEEGRNEHEVHKDEMKDKLRDLSSNPNWRTSRQL